jgi:hypothetical protein
MKKTVHSKEFGNILISLNHEVDEHTTYKDDKPIDGFSSYLSIVWIDKYGDALGYGNMELNIPCNQKLLRDMGAFLIGLAEKF